MTIETHHRILAAGMATCDPDHREIEDPLKPAKGIGRCALVMAVIIAVVAWGVWG